MPFRIHYIKALGSLLSLLIFWGGPTETVDVNVSAGPSKKKERTQSDTLCREYKTGL